MIAKGLATLEAALGRPAETLRSAPVGLHLRHLVSNFSALQRTNESFRLTAAEGG